MSINEKKSTYEDGPHGGAEAPDVVQAEGGEVQKRLADKELKKVSEAFSAIFEGVELPEDFTTKAEGIMEALIKEHIDSAKAKIEEEADVRVSEIADQLEEKFTQTADRFLEFVAERWMKENKLAVVSEAKVATATKIVEGITALLATHNLQIEESTFDQVAELEAKLTESKKEYSSIAEELMAERDKTAKLVAEHALRDIQEGMVLTDADKLASLVEGFDYSDVAKYRTKVEAVKEATFKAISEEKTPTVENALHEEFQAKTEDVPAKAEQSGMLADIRRYM